MKILSIKDYMNIMLRRLWVIILMGIMILMFFVVYKFFMPKTYLAKTTILIKSNDLQLMDIKTNPMAGDTWKRHFQDQLNLLKSSFLAERVMRKLDINMPLEKFKSMVNIDAIFRTNMVEVAVSGSNSIKITEIANTWVREFIYQDMERRMGVAEYGISRLEKQIEETAQKLHDAKKELNEFVQKYGVWAEREQLIDTLKKQERRLERELIEQSAKYKEKHSKIISLNEQLREVKEQRISETEKLVALQDQAASYNAISKRLETYEAIYSELINRSKRLDTARGLAMSDTRIIDVARVPKAPTSLPSKVQMAIIFGGMFFAFLLCFVIEYYDSSLRAPEEVEFYAKMPFLGEIPSGIKEFAKENIDNFYKVADSYIYSEMAGAFRNLQVALLFSSSEKEMKTFLITSANAKEGKTTVASNIAISFAHAEENTLLIDADIKKGDLSNVFGCSDKPGLSNILQGDATLESAEIRTTIKNLSILPAGRLISAATEILETEKVNALIAEVKSKFQRVIIDIPAILVSSEALILGGKCDGTIFVIKEGVTELQTILSAKKRLDVAKIKINGALLNNFASEKETAIHFYYYKKFIQKVKTMTKKREKQVTV
ncbi:capsular exopolysaccharide family protein [Candidatus Omnitrophus magneticus]|uniref:non-specific protein-tyrosine kinase n=1 Tax=Candidatus Omnitrophus magneticus TaxID=1609969 RepID=A0A0F0CV38_9BACT|nr:capsular exopolysaccharide family protein [Candidatus Omnitrophus magneticus]